MKRTLFTLLSCAVLGLPAMALEKRTFTSADGSKTFEGRLTDYDAKKGLVTVRKGMRNLTFKLSLLSEEDVAYVNENANALAAANSIRLDFDLYKDKATTNRTDTERTTTTPAGYEIAVRNWTKNNIEDIEIRYTIFHRKDAENGPGSITTTEGSTHISTLFSNTEDVNRTDPINLVRYSGRSRAADEAAPLANPAVAGLMDCSDALQRLS